MQADTLTAGNGQPTFESLLDMFIDHILEYRGYAPATADAYRRDCERLFDYLREATTCDEPGDVSPRDVRLFLNSLRHLAPSSVRRTLYGISSFFEYLCDMEILSQNPAAPVDPPKVKHKLPEVPSRSRCNRLLQACEPPIESAVIGLFLLAGLRRSEALGLDVADVAADLNSMRIEGKGGRQRNVPLSSELRVILDTYLAERDEANSSALLLNAVGNRMQATTLYRLFRRVLERAGLGDSGITPHSLRHAFATELVRAGVDVATISDLLGHASIATTSIYLHANSATKRDAVECLDFAGSKTESRPHMQRP